jgi:hypothetical protein
MAKEFYTEKDIEDICKSGVMSLDVHENVVLTELAYEKARRLGMKLVRDTPDHPPAAPVRPYISQRQVAKAAGSEKPRAVSGPAVTKDPVASAVGSDLSHRIRDAVIARVGTQVDRGLLDVMIRRVLANTGVK